MLIILPDVIPPSIRWLRSLTQITALVDDRIGTELPATAVWPAVRLDASGGLPIVEFRIDRPRLQVQCFDLTDQGAMNVARTVRAGFVAMAGYREAGVIVVLDVTTSTPQIIEDHALSAEPARIPPISHASFSASVAVRPDP